MFLFFISCYFIIFTNESPGLFRHRPGHSLGEKIKWHKMKKLSGFLHFKNMANFEHFIKHKPLFSDEWNYTLFITKIMSVKINTIIFLKQNFRSHFSYLWISYGIDHGIFFTRTFRYLSETKPVKNNFCILYLLAGNGNFIFDLLIFFLGKPFIKKIYSKPAQL